MYRPAKDMTQHSSELSLLLLAAGQSLRMGSENKLLLPYKRKPLICHVADQLLQADIGKVTVVTGYEEDKIRQALKHLPVNFAHNPDFEAGQMTSVHSGAQVALAQRADGMMVVLADMPFLTAGDYRYIRDGFHTLMGSRIMVPYFGRERGNPILIPAPFVREIAHRNPNAGCREILKRYPDKIQKIDVTSSAFVRDIDRLQDYRSLVSHAGMPLAPCC